MRKLYDDNRPILFRPERWSVTEDVFDEGTNRVRESVFAVANGYIGVRGFFEEGFDGAPEHTDPTVMLNGVYEYHDIVYNWRRPGFPGRTQVITRQANPLDVTVYLDGERAAMTREGYSRSLNLKNGVLTRTFVFTTQTGKKAVLTFERFACQQDKHLLAARITIEARAPLSCRIVSALRTADSRIHDGEGKDAVYEPLGLSRTGEVATAAYKTKKSGFSVACAAAERLSVPAEAETSESGSALVCSRSFSLDAGDVAVYERTAGFACDKDVPDYASFLAEKVRKAAARGYEALLEENTKEIAAFWSYSDIEIDDDPLVQQGIRFSLFQVYQSAGRDGYTNISANGLSGTVYSGQTFWDTEMYMMPMFTYGAQEISRDLLLYRYHLLDRSRERAQQMEDVGALYSWNTIDGEECGAIFEAATAQYHIDADISFAMQAYYDASGDEAFMVDFGAEMLFEMSKCLSHRGSFIEARGGKFCINVICGPDEYNPIVDNNFYTNFLVRRMFDFTLETRALLAEKYPERLAALCQKCGMTEAEFGRIEEASRKMYFPYNEEYGMYMQDDNFMYKDPVDLASVPAEKLPLLFTLHPLNLWRWQVCKQADIVLLTFLCSEFFDKEQIRKIFDYYEPKTIHDSSLSAAVHSIVACAIGYRGEAYSYLKHAARMDLDDVNGNTAAGLHAACMGGAWMLIVNGYAGLRVYGGTLHFDPMLDDKWKGYSFKIHYHGCMLSVRVARDGTRYRLEAGERLEIFHRGEAVTVGREEIFLPHA